MVGRDQYGYIKGPYYMIKPGPKPPGEHNKVESKMLHKLGGFPKLRAAASAARKAFSQCVGRANPTEHRGPCCGITFCLRPVSRHHFT